MKVEGVEKNRGKGKHKPSDLPSGGTQGRSSGIVKNPSSFFTEILSSLSSSSASSESSPSPQSTIFSIGADIVQALLK